MNVKTLLLVIAITVTSVLLGAIYINVRYFFYLSGIEILSAITVISASYSVISLSSLILVCKMRKEKEKKADIKILSAIAVISALIAVFLFTLLILLPKEAVQQSKNGRKRRTNRALNPKRSEIFSAKSNCGTASKGPEVPEKPVFIIKDDAVKKDLIERGLLGQNNGFVDMKGIKELIEKGIYKLNDSTLEMNITAQQPDIPEKIPVFKIEEEAVKEDLIRRGLMGEYPNGTRYVNLSGVEELIKKGVYRINPDGTLELVHVPSE